MSSCVTPLIQCFEFTYELSHKMLKRYLESTAASPEEIDFITFAEAKFLAANISNRRTWP